VAQELDGLMKLKPALGQFLIYGPVPGTPFHERIIRDNLLQDVYTSDKDLFYRRADGFSTMIKHPTLTPEAIEEIQRWCFEQDFQRLGPSIFRVIEAWLLGYRKLRHSPNPMLRKKAEFFAKQLRGSYAIFLAGKWLGPNPDRRQWIAGLQRQVYAEIGAPTAGENLKSVLAVGAALWTAVTLKLNLFQHPRLTRTTYRLPGAMAVSHRIWEELQRKLSTPHLAVEIEVKQAKEQVWMRLDGAVTAADAENLGRRIRESLAQTGNRLVLDLNRLNWNKVDTLRPLTELLADYRSRIRLIVPKFAAAHPECLLLASIFPLLDL
jgi:hypothetical protein